MPCAARGGSGHLSDHTWSISIRWSLNCMEPCSSPVCFIGVMVPLEGLRPTLSPLSARLWSKQLNSITQMAPWGPRLQPTGFLIPSMRHIHTVSANTVEATLNIWATGSVQNVFDLYLFVCEVCGGEIMNAGLFWVWGWVKHQVHNINMAINK